MDEQETYPTTVIPAKAGIQLNRKHHTFFIYCFGGAGILPSFMQKGRRDHRRGRLWLLAPPELDFAFGFDWIPAFAGMTPCFVIFMDFPRAICHPSIETRRATRLRKYIIFYIIWCR